MEVVTYGDLARRCAVTWCQDCSWGNHRTGWADPAMRIVHWTDRHVTRAGIRNFLKLVAAIAYGHESQPKWQKLYEQNLWAYRQARAMHMRLPRRLADLDRSRVRYIASKRQISNEAREWSRP